MLRAAQDPKLLPLLRGRPDLLNMVCEDGSSVLNRARGVEMRGQLSMALVEAGSDVKFVPPDGSAPLEVAVGLTDALIEAMLTRGAGDVITPEKWEPLLERAADRPTPFAFEALVARYAHSLPPGPRTDYLQRVVGRGDLELAREAYGGWRTGGALCWVLRHRPEAFPELFAQGLPTEHDVCATGGALAVAITEGNLEAIEAMVRRGIRLHRVDLTVTERQRNPRPVADAPLPPKGWLGPVGTYLDFALAAGHFHIAERLAQLAVPVGEFRGYSPTSLELAIDAGNAPAVAWLLDRGASPNLRCSARRASPLKQARYATHEDIAGLLERAGGRSFETFDQSLLAELANEAKRRGRPDLQAALGSLEDWASGEELVAAARVAGDSWFLRGLYEAGLPPDGLFAAVQEDDSAFAGVLVEAGADLTGAMNQAVRNGSAADVLLLVRLGATLTAEHVAVYERDDEWAAVVALGLANGVAPDAATHQGRLIDLASCRDQGTFHRLFEAGGQPSRESGCPIQPDSATLRLLVASGLDFSKIVRGGADALVARATSTTPEASEDLALLLAHGAEPNTSNDSGQLALIAAVDAGAMTSVRILLENGADPNAANTKGHLALHRSVANRQEAMSGLREAVMADLLAYGATLDLPNENGTTPLMLAAGTEDMAALEFLLMRGADEGLRDHKGQTAARYLASALGIRTRGVNVGGIMRAVAVPRSSIERNFYGSDEVGLCVFDSPPGLHEERRARTSGLCTKQWGEGYFSTEDPLAASITSRQLVRCGSRNVEIEYGSSGTTAIARATILTGLGPIHIGVLEHPGPGSRAQRARLRWLAETMACGVGD